jgi:hypothetical protein
MWYGVCVVPSVAMGSFPSQSAFITMGMEQTPIVKSFDGMGPLNGLVQHRRALQHRIKPEMVCLSWCTQTRGSLICETNLNWTVVIHDLMCDWACRPEDEG